MKIFGIEFNINTFNFGSMHVGKMKWRDFAKERYLRMAKAFPGVKQEHVEIYVMLILTFVSMSFLGIFAISPTISTIVELNKKLDDSKFVFQALETKKANLSALHTQYDELQNSWPAVHAAVPDQPQAAYVIGQVQQLAKQQNLIITAVQSAPVELTKHGDNPTAQASYVFTISVSGSTDGMKAFLQSLTDFDRIVHVESVTLANEERQILTVRIRTYFTP